MIKILMTQTTAGIQNVIGFLPFALVWVIRKFGFRICFGFRYSNFGFMYASPLCEYPSRFPCARIFTIPGVRAAGWILLAVLFFGIASCSPRQMAVRELSAVLQNGVDRFEEDEDLALIEAALPGNIKLAETLLAETPDDDRLRILLARLYGSYAFAFAERDLEEETLLPGRRPPAIESETPEQAVRRYYRKGADYALSVIEARYPGCTAQLGSVSESEACFARFGKDDLPALFWYGFDLGGYVNRSRGSVKALSRAHLAEKAMKKVIDIDASFYHGGAHLFLMIYYAARPPMAGGSIEAATHHYRELTSMHGVGFFPADLFYARYVLYRQQDRDAFHRVLTNIVQQPVEPGPHRLLNKVAADRAALYLAAEDRLFP